MSYASYAESGYGDGDGNGMIVGGYYKSSKNASVRASKKKFMEILKRRGYDDADIAEAWKREQNSTVKRDLRKSFKAAKKTPKRKPAKRTKMSVAEKQSIHKKLMKFKADVRSLLKTTSLKRAVDNVKLFASNL
jgi:hypothetical protein